MLAKKLSMALKLDGVPRYFIKKVRGTGTGTFGTWYRVPILKKYRGTFVHGTAHLCSQVSLFIGVKNDRPKTNLPKWKGIQPFRCSTWVCLSANVLFRSGQCLDKTSLFRVHCQQVSKTHHSSTEHQRPYCKQNERSSSPCSSLRHSSSYYS